MQRPTIRHWALIGAMALVLSTLGFSTSGVLLGAGSDEDARAAATQTTAHGAPQHLAPMLSLDDPPQIIHVPPFSVETGNVPTKSDALDFSSRYTRFIAKGTEGLDRLASDGHLAGSGTNADPYVLEHFYVDGDLIIQSTARALILRNGYVNGQLSLNYVGDDLYVHHVYAKDLRVNENVERSGTNTGGLFHDNHFGFVGQIRHFVGEFRHNQVGPIPDGTVRTYLSDTGDAEVPEGVVFNFDGFHGALVHHNVFDGQVDIKLHGHNHGDCLTCPIHDHADPRQLAFDERTANRSAATGRQAAPVEDEGQHDQDADHGPVGGDEGMTLADALGFRTRHSVRYHSLLFEANTVRVSDGAAYALRYNDLAHAGDDRTANSEPNRFLEDPHVHYQDITFRANQLNGGAFLLQVFNAADDAHVTQNEGILRLIENEVELGYERTTQRQAPLYGFDLRHGDGILLHIRGNDVRFTERDDAMPAPALRSVLTHAPALIGFRLDRFSMGDVAFIENSVGQGQLGVYAHLLAPDLHWSLHDNDFRTENEWRGERVAHPPEGGDDA